MIPNGGIVEQEVPYNMDESEITLTFKNRNLTDLVKAKEAINGMAGLSVAKITSPSTMEVDVPENQKGNFYVYLDKILSTEIEPTNLARVVVDERTGDYSDGGRRETEHCCCIPRQSDHYNKFYCGEAGSELPR